MNQIDQEYFTFSVDSRFGISKSSGHSVFRFATVQWAVFDTAIRVDVIIRGIFRLSKYEVVIPMREVTK